VLHCGDDVRASVFVENVSASGQGMRIGLAVTTVATDVLYGRDAREQTAPLSTPTAEFVIDRWHRGENRKVQL
jgi:hypothetical protein